MTTLDRRPRFARIAATALLTGALVAGGAVTAFAAPSTPAPAAAAASARCDRADQVTQRLEKVLTRLQGDAQQEGSPAWLRVRADRVKSAGHADLAASLRARADRREQRVPQVEAALDRLAAAVATHCPAAAS
jgi:hypothetical protein